MSDVPSRASVAVCLPHGILPRASVRWWEANTSVCTPQRTPISCTRTSPSSSTTPVRWEPKRHQRQICSSPLLRASAHRWRWRTPTCAASPGSPRRRTWTACCSPETCSSSPSSTGTTCARWSSASPSASGGRDATADPTRLPAAKSDLFAELI